MLPEKLADFCERGEKAFVAFRIAGFSRQAKIGSQLGIGRRDIFIATLAGKPAIKSTRNGASLFKRRFADKRTAQIVHVGQLELVRIVVAPQGREEFFVAQKLSQSLKHQGALARNNRVVLQRIAILAGGAAGFHVFTAEGAIEFVNAAQLFLQSDRALLFAVSVAVIKQRRPVCERFVENRFTRRIVTDRRTPPLMRNHVRDGPFQTVLD